VGPVLAKKYVLIRQDSSGPLAKEIRDKYKVGRNSVTLISPEGDVLARLLNEPSAEDVFAAIDGLTDFRAGMEQFAKLKEKGITKANAESVAAALKRIGALPSAEARETILPYAKDDQGPESIQRGAILGLAKHPDAAGDIVPFLTDKRYPIKSAAQTAVTGMGVKALPALLEALASEDVNVRAAVYAPAAAATKNGKIAKDLGFWKTGKEDARAKALSEWKNWYDEQTKAKEKDAYKGQKEPKEPKKKG
jgi:HEAT repeat protein